MSDFFELLKFYRKSRELGSIFVACSQKTNGRLSATSDFLFRGQGKKTKEKRIAIWVQL